MPAGIGPTDALDPEGAARPHHRIRNCWLRPVIRHRRKLARINRIEFVRFPCALCPHLFPFFYCGLLARQEFHTCDLAALSRSARAALESRPPAD
ncbi:hypothetical protein [Pandoravirus japonicus]|uniref:Uncharacterized protein n=1 Tax=Pandoravirus japonicus TaxID=2823154 RepID=A0A811BNZ7_9VIRU|nr:hypothetical protein [Pandoravirus japonicus]